MDHMRRVVSYIHRHQCQQPEEENVQDSKWRYSRIYFPDVPKRNAPLSFANPPRWARSRRSSWRWSSG